MSTLTEHHEKHGAHFVQIGLIRVPAHFGDSRGEYEACSNRIGLHDRSYRGLIEITGADRAAWLSNLTTNEIKTLPSGRGNYLFALNVKGRVLFDANVLVLADALWLDIDRRLIPAACSHLDKYIISEDVRLTDHSDDFARLALIGPGGSELVQVASRSTAFQAVSNLANMAQLQHEVLHIGGSPCRVIRNDFGGLPGFEIIAPADKALSAWDRFTHGQDAHATPVGLDALQILRVEAGIPWSIEDINEDVLPAETRQLDRAVSFTKGCYLGQEVVERMRAHHVVARLLIGLVFDADVGQTPPSATPNVAWNPPPELPCLPGAALLHEGQAVGRVTSVVNSIALGRPLGLGYVKSAMAASGTSLSTASGKSTLSCAVRHLPFEKPGKSRLGKSEEDC